MMKATTTAATTGQQLQPPRLPRRPGALHPPSSSGDDARADDATCEGDGSGSGGRLTETTAGPVVFNGGGGREKGASACVGRGPAGGPGENRRDDPSDENDTGGNGEDDRRSRRIVGAAGNDLVEEPSWELSVESKSSAEFASSPSSPAGLSAGGHGLLRSSLASASASPAHRLSNSSSSFRASTAKAAAAAAAPSASRRRLQLQGDKLSSFTINRLRFDRLSRLYGREREQQALLRVFDDVYTSWESTRKRTAATGSSPAATGQHTAAEEGDSESSSSERVDLLSSPDAEAPLPTSSGTASPPGGAADVRRHLVAIHGAPGAGKTALAAALRPAAAGKSGFYASGKFSQPSSMTSAAVAIAAAEPYEAFAAACQELCDSLLLLTPHGGPPTAANKNTADGSCCSSPTGPASTASTGPMTATTASISESPSSASEPSPDQGRQRRTLAQLRAQLDEDLSDEEADALVRTLPAMRQLLGKRDPPAGAATAAAAAAADQEPPSRGLADGPRLFRRAFCRFLRALASLGPVVLVVDDLQWADAASLELLEAIASDRDAVGLVVVACYRDGDVEKEAEDGAEDGPAAGTAAAYRKTVQNIQAKSQEEVDFGLGVSRVSVGNLRVDDVNELLEDLLSLPEDRTVELAQCVHKRTMGNAFFVVQFLMMLWETELLTFNFGGMSWTWDVDAIVQSTASTENVAKLMTRKMRTLPLAVVQALPVLACLGSTFSDIALDTVLTRFAVSPPSIYCTADRATEDPVASQILSLCQEEGLIEELSGRSADDRWFQWVHDKIHEAAFALIEDDGLGPLQREMGQALYVGLDVDALERHLYTVVNLMRSPPAATAEHRAPSPLVDPIVAAGLYLRAGSKAIESSAFEQAAIYASTGIDLLPPNRWESHYELSLSLYSMAAEAEFCTGSFERMRGHCSEVIQQEKIRLLDKRRAYAVWIESIGAENRWGEALALCKRILVQLGARLPRRAVTVHTIGGMLKAKRAVKKEFSLRVQKLPVMKDEKQLWVMYLLDRVCYFAYFLKSPLMALAIFRGLDVTLKHGICHYSPTCLASAGLILSAFMKDYQGGITCADQALEMLKRVDGARQVEARATHVCHVLIYHWQRPLPLSIKPLLATYRRGLAVGDTETAAWCIYFYLEHSFHSGASLESLAADCAFYAPVLHDVKQLHIHQILLNLWQTVLLLAGKNEFDGTLTGEIVQQRALLSKQPADEHFAANIYRMQMYVAFVLGEHRLVRAAIDATGAHKGYFEKAFPGIAGLVHVSALNALSMFSLYRETKDRATLRLARRFALNIKRLALAGNPNVTQFDSMLDGEWESLRGDHYTACRHYEAAVLYAGRRGWRQDQALAHERYGLHLLSRSEEEEDDDDDRAKDAHYHLRQAAQLYDEWGAHAKVDRLRRAHPSLAGSTSSPQAQPSPEVEILDLGRLIESSP